MGGGKGGKGGAKGGKGKKNKSKSRKSLNFKSVPTTDDASARHDAAGPAAPAAAAPRSGKDLWSLDSVKNLAPPPKNPP